MTKYNINALSFTLGIIALVLGVRLHIIDAFAYFTPYYDDWGMGGTLQEHESRELTLKFLLSPNNGHIGIWRELLQIELFDINQSQWDTYLQMVVNAIIWTVSATFLATIIRRHFKSASVPIAISFIIILWTFPLSLINATWGVQTHNYNMILFSVVAIWMTQGEAYTKAWWFGLLMTFMVPLTMGAGSLVAPAILGFVILRIIVSRDDWQTVRPTLIAMTLLAIYSIWILKRSSSGHEVYYAKSIADFLNTFFKSLAFPVIGKLWAAPVLLAPMIILVIQATRFKMLNRKTISFTIILSAYTIGIALATGYARGSLGRDPSDRYFEFFQVYILASLLSLLLIQSRPLRLKKVANSFILVSWAYTVFLGALNQVTYFNSERANRSVVKPIQDDIFKKYLAVKDLSVFAGIPREHLPFPSGPGLAKFVSKIQQEDIMSYQMQSPLPLFDDGASEAFVVNGTIAPNKGNWQYQYGHESAIGSFNRENGGGAATGKFVSTPLKYDRNHLMIPVTGHFGAQGMSLSLIDLKTGEETPVLAPEFGSESNDEWHEVFVKTPKNEFQIVALDNNPELWFGFAAPRSIGRLSTISNWMIANGKHIWKIGVLFLLLSFRDSLPRLISQDDIAS